MAKRTLVVFTGRTVSGRQRSTSDPKVEINYGIYLDMDLLDSRALKISGNKNRKGTLGPIHFEVHRITKLESK